MSHICHELGTLKFLNLIAAISADYDGSDNELDIHTPLPKKRLGTSLTVCYKFLARFKFFVSSFNSAEMIFFFAFSRIIDDRRCSSMKNLIIHYNRKQ